MFKTRRTKSLNFVNIEEVDSTRGNSVSSNNPMMT